MISTEVKNSPGATPYAPALGLARDRPIASVPLLTMTLPPLLLINVMPEIVEVVPFLT